MTVELALVVAAAGVVVGVMSALFGVGGGILMVPFIVLALAQPQHLAEGTSLLVIVPTAVVGVVAHRRRGYVSFRHALLLAAGGIGGAYAGAALALQLPGWVLQDVFAVLMAVVGVRTIRKGLGRLSRDRARPASEPPAHELGGPELD